MGHVSHLPTPIFLFSRMLVGGLSEKFGRVPRTRERVRAVGPFKHSDRTEGDQKSSTGGTSSQNCESVYTCPCTPFYRETKGLLHSENTLELQEYS
jgi:hypothetical protein